MLPLKEASRQIILFEYNSIRGNRHTLMPQKIENFSAIEAAKIIGVPYRTVDHWARTSVISPSLAEARGTGTERKYSFYDLVALSVARDLRKTGISLRALRAITKQLRTEEDRPHPFSGARFFVVGSDVVMFNNCTEAASVLKNPGQGVFAFMLDLRTTVAELNVRVQKLRAA